MDTITLPSSEEAEREILGSILLDNSSFYFTESLSIDDFQLRIHRDIYRAMINLADAGKPIEFVGIGEMLKEAGVKPDFACIASLTDGAVTSHIKSNVQVVISHSKRRKIMTAGQAAINAAIDPTQAPERTIQVFDQRLLEIAAGEKSGPKKTVDILVEAEKQIEDEIKSSMEDGGVGYTSGIKAYDKMTTGYRKREVTVIAGETSDGKSSLMRQGIIANGLKNKRQLVFSREVSRQRVILDIKTAISGVLPSHVRDPSRMDLMELARFKDVDKALRSWNLWIDDSRGLHITELFHSARKFIRMEGVEIIWVDYMQLVKGSGATKTERQEDVCAGLWALCDSENVALVGLSQLNRQDDGKGKKVRPNLRRLKDSSKIEQDAHTLAFVYQPEDESGKRDPNNAEIIIAKQRHGPTGAIPVRFTHDLLFEERF